MFAKGVDAEFEKMEHDRGFMGFMDEDNDHSETYEKFTKMPSGLSEFEEIKHELESFIFGERRDVILEKVNSFLETFSDIREALDSSLFPNLLLLLLYWPVYLIIMVLNAIKDGLIFWMLALVILGLAFGAMGAIMTVCFTGYRCYRIYSSRFGSPFGSPPEEEQ